MWNAGMKAGGSMQASFVSFCSSLFVIAFAWNCPEFKKARRRAFRELMRQSRETVLNLRTVYKPASP
jgi:hypothetical protein